MDDLIQNLAKKEAEDLGRRSIDGVEDYFTKRLHVDLKDSRSWEIVREAHYRRNLIVHNRGRKNELFQAQGLAKSRTEKNLDTKYVEEVVCTLTELSRFISDSLISQHKIS